jgi:hypothetical protein
VPAQTELEQIILRGAQDTPYTTHPESTKMYKDMKDSYWWNGTNKDIA